MRTYHVGMDKLPQSSFLQDAGLNRLHVFNLADLPQALLTPLELLAHERQLILFGHAGRTLWTRVQALRLATDNPIDEYSVHTVQSWLVQALPRARARFVFPHGLPPGQHVGLQTLGRLAGWQHGSPLMLGIDPQWGSWFAYRAVIITDTDLPGTTAHVSEPPCLTCEGRPCVTACAGRALDRGQLDAQACQSKRLEVDSVCALDCPARNACPVGAAHRYDKSQIEHGARCSLAALRSDAGNRR